jgi:hypothetical protein
VCKEKYNELHISDLKAPILQFPERLSCFFESSQSGVSVDGTASRAVQLIQSGEKERLKELLRERLVGCGWKDDLLVECR